MFSFKETINSTRATLRSWSLDDSSPRCSDATGGRATTGITDRLLQQQHSFKKKQKDDQSGHGGGGSGSHATTAAADEYRKAHDEVERLRRILLGLKGNYDESKQHHFFRRYRLLKGMIKRTAMYVRIGTAPDELCGGICLGQLVLLSSNGSSTRKVTSSQASAKGAAGSAPELPRAAQLPEKTKELRQQAASLRTAMENLERAYECSKQYMPVQRYRLLKAMIKRALRDGQQ